MNAWRVAQLSLVRIALAEVDQPVEPPGSQQSAVKYVQPTSVRPANHEYVSATKKMRKMISVEFGEKQRLGQFVP